MAVNEATRLYLNHLRSRNIDKARCIICGGEAKELLSNGYDLSFICNNHEE